MRHGAVGACGPGLCLLPIALLHGPTPPSPSTMNTLPELLALEKIIELGAPHLQVQVVRQVQLASGHSFPIPAIGFFGGVHGLERIGAEVVIAYLQNVVMRLQWDTTLHRQLEQMRLVFMPVVNPGGMWASW